jgi:sulfide:quinone oxidoreductase
MLRTIQLEDGLAVAPQLVAPDFAGLAQMGFRTVVNNRPDGEVAGQLPSAEAEQAARAAGLGYHYLPVANARVTDADVVHAFTVLIQTVPRPLLAYCRSGTRCTLLWAQARAKVLGCETTLGIGRGAGFNMGALRSRPGFQEVFGD